MGSARTNQRRRKRGDDRTADRSSAAGGGARGDTPFPYRMAFPGVCHILRDLALPPSGGTGGGRERRCNVEI